MKRKWFNLLYEKWLCCSFENGESEKLGISDVLKNAHLITDVGGSPALRLNFLRVLIAVLHEPNLMPLAKLMNRERSRFDPSIEKKLANIEDYFWLFHPDHPIFQDESLRSKAQEKPASYLFTSLPSGTNINHFKHCFDDSVSVCLSCCAVGLFEINIFAAKGKTATTTTINSNAAQTPPLYLYEKGPTYFQTILRNIRGNKLPSYDLPSWRGTTEGKFQDKQIGLQEGLTWQSKRVLVGMISDKPGDCTLCAAKNTVVVANIVHDKGRQKSDESDRPWIDPHAVIVDGKPFQAPDPMQAYQRRFPGFWRDQIRNILITFSRDNQAGNLTDDVGLPPLQTKAMATAFHTDGQSKIYCVTENEWTFSRNLSSDTRLTKSLIDALAHTDEALQKFFNSRRYAEYRRGNETKARLMAGIWPFEERAQALFREVLRVVAEHPDQHEDLISDYKRQLAQIAHNAFGPMQGGTGVIENAQTQLRYEKNLRSTFGFGPEHSSAEFNTRAEFKEFIIALTELANGELSLIRRSWNKVDGGALASLNLFIKIHRNLSKRVSRQAPLLVFKLFPWHINRTVIDGKSLAQSLRIAEARHQRKHKSGYSSRINSVLTARGLVLETRLLEAVRFLACEEVPLDWSRLLHDLARWDERGAPTQRAWAAQYWND